MGIPQKTIDTITADEYLSIDIGLRFSKNTASKNRKKGSNDTLQRSKRQKPAR
jgi:hypothetical protein